MSKDIGDRLYQGLIKSGWRESRVGLGKHGWKMYPPQEIKSDYNEQFLTIQRKINTRIQKNITTQITRFYTLRDGIKVHYSKEQAEEILSGSSVSLE